MDYVLEYMKRRRLPLTLDVYLNLAYMGDITSLDQLDAEQLAGIPEEVMNGVGIEETLALLALPVSWTIH